MTTFAPPVGLNWPIAWHWRHGEALGGHHFPAGAQIIGMRLLALLQVAGRSLRDQRVGELGPVAGGEKVGQFPGLLGCGLFRLAVVEAGHSQLNRGPDRIRIFQECGQPGGLHLVPLAKQRRRQTVPERFEWAPGLLGLRGRIQEGEAAADPFFLADLGLVEHEVVADVEGIAADRDRLPELYGRLILDETGRHALDRDRRFAHRRGRVPARPRSRYCPASSWDRR